MVFYSKRIISRILYKVNTLVQNLADYQKKISHFIQHWPDSYSFFEYHVTIGASCRHAVKVLSLPTFSRFQALRKQIRTSKERCSSGCIFSCLIMLKSAIIPELILAQKRKMCYIYSIAANARRCLLPCGYGGTAYTIDLKSIAFGLRVQIPLSAP